jgi:hypothetical protein
LPLDPPGGLRYLLTIANGRGWPGGWRLGWFCSRFLQLLKVANVTITRVGTNAKYADGWDTAFKAGKAGTKSAAKKGPATKKKASPKKAGKKAKK